MPPSRCTSPRLLSWVACPTPPKHCCQHTINLRLVSPSMYVLLSKSVPLRADTPTRGLDRPVGSGGYTLLPCLCIFLATKPRGWLTRSSVAISTFSSFVREASRQVDYLTYRTQSSRSEAPLECHVDSRVALLSDDLKARHRRSVAGALRFASVGDGLCVSAHGAQHGAPLCCCPASVNPQYRGQHPLHVAPKSARTAGFPAEIRHSRPLIVKVQFRVVSDIQSYSRAP